MQEFGFNARGAFSYETTLGKGFGSVVLANIFYQFPSGAFSYKVDGSGNTVLDNQGLNNAANDGLLYSGRAIELGALNDVDIPIHHTLGADNKKLATSVDTGWTDNLDNTYTGSTVTGDIVGLTTLTSGTFKVTITLSSVTAGDVNGYTLDGTYVFEETLTASLNLTGTGFTGVVTVVSAEQITNPNSYLTLYDFTNGFEYIDCSLLTPSTTYTVNSKTINNILTHTTEWVDLDKAKIEANPNLVGKLALETLGATKTIPELDMVMDAGASPDSYYMCSEKSGACLVDSRVAYGATIVTNGTFDTDTDWTKGTGWTISAGVASCDGTQVADSLLTTLTVPTTVASSTYLVSFQVTACTAGNVALQFDGVEIIPDKAVVGTYYAIATASDTTGTIDVVADLNFVGSVDNVTAQLISSIPIASYTETIRTNADQQQKGIQTTAFVTDGAGVPQSYSSKFLQFNGDGRYVDTQYMPESGSSFSIELAIDTPADTIVRSYLYYNGTSTDTTNLRLSIRQDFIAINIGNAVLTVFTTMSGVRHIVITHDGTNQTLYVGGVSIGTNTSTYTKLAGRTLIIGAGSLGATKNFYAHDNKFKLFKIYDNKALDATEVANAYASFIALP